MGGVLIVIDRSITINNPPHKIAPPGCHGLPSVAPITASITIFGSAPTVRIPEAKIYELWGFTSQASLHLKHYPIFIGE
jgi:hypothetical protein